MEIDLLKSPLLIRVLATGKTSIYRFPKEYQKFRKCLILHGL